MFKKKKKPEAEAAEAEAAPAAAEGEAAEGAAKKKLPLKMMIIIGLAVLLVGGGGGGGAYVFLIKGKPKPAAAAKAKPKPKKKAGGEGAGAAGKDGAGSTREGPDGVTYYMMPKVRVNMQTSTGKPALLELKLTFEAKDAEAIDAMDPNLPRLNDALQTFLRELRPEDLAGSEGSYALRMEIARRINLVIAPYKIDAVRIEEQLIA